MSHSHTPSTRFRDQAQGSGPASESHLTGVLCALAIVALFSGFTLISRLGLSTQLRLADLAALRFGIGGLLLLPVLLRFGLSGLRLRDALTIAFLGGVGFALCAYAGFALAPAAHGAVLLHGSLPLFTFLIVTTLSRQIGSRRLLFGIGLIGAGIVAMAWDSLVGATSRQLLGDGFLLIAAVLWSSSGVVIRRTGVAPIRAAAIVTVLSAGAFLPVYAVLPGTALLSVGWSELLLQGAFQGLLIGVCSIFVYTRAVASLGASGTAAFTAAVPAVTTLAAVPVLSEAPSPIALAGVAIATVGMLVAVRASWPKKPTDPQANEAPTQ